MRPSHTDQNSRTALGFDTRWKKDRSPSGSRSRRALVAIRQHTLAAIAAHDGDVRDESVPFSDLQLRLKNASLSSGQNDWGDCDPLSKMRPDQNLSIEMKDFLPSCRFVWTKSRDCSVPIIYWPLTHDSAGLFFVCLYLSFCCCSWWWWW